MTYLLDAAVLIPLLISDHEHHTAAKNWIAGRSLAVCPLVELAYLRVATGFYNASQADAREILAEFYAGKSVKKTPVDIFPLDARPFPSSKKSTDWFLCELAEKNQMRLATFDGGMEHPAAEVITLKDLPAQ